MRQRGGLRTYVVVISLASVGITLAVQAVSPALPELQRVLGLSNSEIGWIVTAYVLPGVLFTVPMGILGDNIGKRFLFCVALVIYGVAGIVQGTFLSYPLLLGTRVIQGACFAAAMPLTITFIGEEFSGTKRIRALAGRNAFLTGSEVIAPTLGAVLAGLSWRAPLLVQSVTIPLAIYALAILRKEQASRGAKRKYARDLIRVLREQAGMAAVLLTAFSRYFFKLILLAFLPVLLVNERGASLTQVGLVLSFGSLVAVVTSLGVPRLIRRVPPSAAAIGSVLGLGVATGAFALVPGWKWSLLVAAAYGVGDGIIAVLQDTYAIHTSRSHVRAGMVSVSQTAKNLGKFVGPLTMTAVVAISSLDIAFLVMALAGLGMAPLLLPLKRMDSELQETSFDRAAEAAHVGSIEDLPYE